jgi:hypothetical protein
MMASAARRFASRLHCAALDWSRLSCVDRVQDIAKSAASFVADDKHEHRARFAVGTGDLTNGEFRCKTVRGHRRRSVWRAGPYLVVSEFIRKVDLEGLVRSSYCRARRVHLCYPSMGRLKPRRTTSLKFHRTG